MDKYRVLYVHKSVIFKVDFTLNSDKRVQKQRLDAHRK